MNNVNPNEKVLYEDYKKAPLTEQERHEIENYDFENGSAFNALPVFGTGGMRAVVGNGANYLNRYVIARLNMALGQVISQEKQNANVIIGYDSRNTSVEFSRISYAVLKSFGLQVKVFKRVIPTPLVSFAIRELNADAGIVITASHNPPEYNGFKVYGNDGAQIVPPMDKKIEKLFADLSFAEIKPQVHGWAQTEVAPEDLIEDEVMAPYLSKLKTENFVTQTEKKKPILYSPLHGTGAWVFEKVFADLGFTNFSVLESQKEPNGDFPNTKSANPEERLAFEGLVAEGVKNNIPTLIATDPDSDRVGVAVLKEGKYHFLTGNQIGALLLRSIAPTRKNEKGYIVKTIVTTELQRMIADAYGFETIEVLTGFKYIAEILGNKPANEYIFGGEESYGYLPVSWVRDKDAISSSVAIAELAEKQDLLEILDELHKEHGVYVELLHNIHLKDFGLTVPDIMNRLSDPASILEKKSQGNFIGSRKVIDILDFSKEQPSPETLKAKELKEKLPAASVIQYWLQPEGRITVRPSGTEPKVKIYLSMRSDIQENSLALTRKKLNEEAEQTLKEFLALLKL